MYVLVDNRINKCRKENKVKENKVKENKKNLVLKFVYLINKQKMMEKGKKFLIRYVKPKISNIDGLSDMMNKSCHANQSCQYD